MDYLSHKNNIKVKVYKTLEIQHLCRVHEFLKQKFITENSKEK